MILNVLVVDASEEFGALIRHTLEDTGRYQVFMAMTGTEAVEIGDQNTLHLMIIDFDLTDIDAPTCIHSIRATNPDVAIIAIPPKNDPHDPILNDLPINGLLTKPFYLPELNQIVDKAINPPPQAEEIDLSVDDLPEMTPPATEREAIPPWLEDPKRAGEYLIQLCSTTSAESLILTRAGQCWAQGGALTSPQAEQLAAKIAAIGVGEGSRGAISTFIRLTGMQQDHTLYANRLIPDWVFAMIYPKGTTFGAIRSQARYATELLKGTDPASYADELSSTGQPGVETTPPQSQAPAKVEWISESESVPQDFPFLEELDMPPPEPEVDAPQTFPEQIQRDESAATLPGDWVPDKPRPESHLPFLSGPMEPDAGPEITPQERPPLPDAEYYLPVTAVLVPRFPEHRLEGTLAENLHEWVVRLCLAWDWRADEVSIDPNYLCLTMSISPETAPSNAVLRLRDDLSQRILSAFPEFIENLPSRRFWARSYLLITGGPPQPEQVRKFVQNTRKRQGIEI